MAGNQPNKAGDNFWRFVDKTPDGCWHWQGDITPSYRYGRLCVNGRIKQAHRYAYEISTGPVPKGRILSHTCRNPRCVRPDHLEPITPREQSLRNSNANTQEKFWSRVDKTPDGCWNWLGRPTKQGYGRLSIDGKPTYAHRHAYTLINGPIADDLELDHLCRNRRCVRPDHLEPVSHDVNIRRGDSHWRAITHCKNGHPFTPENTYRRGTTRHCRQCTRDRLHRHRARTQHTQPA